MYSYTLVLCHPTIAPQSESAMNVERRGNTKCETTCTTIFVCLLGVVSLVLSAVCHSILLRVLNQIRHRKKNHKPPSSRESCEREASVPQSHIGRDVYMWCTLGIISIVCRVDIYLRAACGKETNHAHAFNVAARRYQPLSICFNDQNTSFY